MAVDERNIILAFKNAKQRLLLCDYDGVLAPIMSRPEQATPTHEVKQVLAELADRSDVVIVSGRKKETLEEWLGEIPVGLIAEHGLWSKRADGEWTVSAKGSAEWKRDIAAVMRRYEAALTGAFIEEKTAALAFHYREAALKKTGQIVKELITELQLYLAAPSLRVLHGKKVVEVLPADVNKGAAVLGLVSEKPYDFIMAAGDDITDEALFAAMPENACTIKVGEGVTAAKHRVASQPEFMALLARLIEND